MEADTESLRIQVAVCILSGKLDVPVRLGGLHSQSPLGAVPDLGKIVDWVSAHRPDTRSACVPDDQVGLATPGSAESVLDNAVGCFAVHAAHERGDWNPLFRQGEARRLARQPGQ